MRTIVMLIASLLVAFAATAVDWDEILIAGGYDGAFSVDTGDLDGDGDLDIVGTAENANQIVWWENVNGDGTTWSTHTISTEFDRAWHVTIADLDGDNDNDVIVVSNHIGTVHWWENEFGDGTSWNEIVLYDWISVLYACVADVDNDTYLDVLISGGDGTVWLKNEFGDATSWVADHYTYEPSNWLEAADMDGDTDIDVFGGGGYGISWWEFVDGDPPIWIQHNITTTTFSCDGIAVADFDGINGLDVVGVNTAYVDEELAWWENAGGGTSWTKHLLTDTYASNAVFASDIDTDGDMDFLTTDLNGYAVDWWENVDGDGLSWTEYTIGGSLEDPHCVCTADIDGDGDEDVVAAAKLSDVVKLWLQQGSPIPPDPIEITLTPSTYPTIVPLGGSFEYSALIECNLESYTPIDIWTHAILPNGFEIGPIWQVSNLPMGPNTVIEATNIAQTIPMSAPLLQYTFRMQAGILPALVLGEDEFEFEIIAAVDARDGFQNWEAWGYETAFTEAGASTFSEETAPVSYQISRAYPNPFNPSTVLNVNLPESAEMTVAVYNITGQQVAELARGTYPAGLHTLTFDGSHLSGGVYFVRASANGWQASQKVVLLK